MLRPGWYRPPPDGTSDRRPLMRCVCKRPTTKSGCPRISARCRCSGLRCRERPARRIGGHLSNATPSRYSRITFTPQTRRPTAGWETRTRLARYGAAPSGTSIMSTRNTIPGSWMTWRRAWRGPVNLRSWLRFPDGGAVRRRAARGLITRQRGSIADVFTYRVGIGAAAPQLLLRWGSL